MSNQSTRKKLYARHGKATDALAVINQNTKKLDAVADTARFSQDGVDVTISDYSRMQATIGVNMHKLLLFGISRFTSKFDPRQQGGIYEVNFPVHDYILLIGGKISKDKRQRRQQRNAMQKRITKELKLLQHISVTDVDGINFESINLVCRTAAKNGMITIEFSRPFAEYLLKQPKMLIHPELLKLSGRSKTAYALGLKCTRHYYMNQRRHTDAARRLKVKNLLKASPLPSYENILREGKSWRERIKLPFERAMNELVKGNILASWKYEQKQSGSSYQAFQNAMIMFDVKV